jgi:hypothetical protein
MKRKAESSIYGSVICKCGVNVLPMSLMQYEVRGLSNDEVRITFTDEALHCDTVKVVVATGAQKSDSLVCKNCGNVVAYIFEGVPSFSAGNKVKLVLPTGQCVLDHTSGCCKEGTPCGTIKGDKGKRRSKWIDHHFLNLDRYMLSQRSTTERGEDSKVFPPHMALPSLNEIRNDVTGSAISLVDLAKRGEHENVHDNLVVAQKYLGDVFKSDFATSFARGMKMKPVMTLEPLRLHHPLEFRLLESRSGCILFKVHNVLQSPVYPKPLFEVGDFEETKWVRRFTPPYVALLGVIGVSLKALVKIASQWPYGRYFECVGQIMHLENILNHQVITVHFDNAVYLTELLQCLGHKFEMTVLSRQYWYYAAISRSLYNKTSRPGNSSGPLLSTRRIKLKDGKTVIDFDSTPWEDAVKSLVSSEGLDIGQAKAVLIALGFNGSSSGPTLLTGPPGTGKTRTITTLVSLICSNQPILEAKGCKILIACRTNNCVDDTAKKLKQHLLSVPALRGPPNINDGLRYKIGRVGGVNWEESDAAAKAKKLKEKTNVKMATAGGVRLTRNHREREEELKEKLNQIENYLKRVESDVVRRVQYADQEFEKVSSDLKKTLHEYHLLRCQREGKVLKKFDILLMTTSKAAMVNDLLRTYFEPSVVIIDEAAQEFSGVILPTVRIESAKLVLIAGDPSQLPPRAECTETHSALYGSIMKTLQGVERKHGLSTQYRMIPSLGDIVRLSTPYESLIDASETRTRVDKDPYAFDIKKPFIFFHCDGVERQLNVSVAGSQMIPKFEEHLEAPTIVDEDDEDNPLVASWSNAVEADSILKYVEDLYRRKLSSMSKIAIISPYNSQVNLLRRRLTNFVRPSPTEEYTEEDIEREKNRFLDDITTPEKYQGKENDIVIVSLVRSNKGGQIGFLNMEERLNVLLSRSRNRLVLFGNFETFKRYVQKQPAEKLDTMLWARLVQHCLVQEAVFMFTNVLESSSVVLEDEGDGIDDVANVLEDLGLDGLDRVDEGVGIEGEYESDEDEMITGAGDGGGKRRKVY